MESILDLIFNFWVGAAVLAIVLAKSSFKLVPQNRAYVVDWAGICRGSCLWDVIKFLDFELNDSILGVFLHAYATRLNRDGTLFEFDDLCKTFYLAQAWYLCGTIQFIAGIRQEHLHDPGTEWIWEFVHNRQIFAHLATKMI